MPDGEGTAEGQKKTGEAGAVETQQAEPASDAAIADLRKGYKWMQGAYQQQLEINRAHHGEIAQLKDLVTVLAQGVTEGVEQGNGDDSDLDTPSVTRKAKVNPIKAQLEAAKQQHAQTSEAAQWFRNDIRTTMGKLGVSEAEVPGLESFELELASNPAAAWQRARERILDAAASRRQVKQTLPTKEAPTNLEALEPEIRTSAPPSGGRRTFTAAEIKNMPLPEYAKRKAEIDEAFRQGRIK